LFEHFEDHPLIGRLQTNPSMGESRGGRGERADPAGNLLTLIDRGKQNNKQIIWLPFVSFTLEKILPGSGK